MSRVFFTSDTHFGHKNIIKYCNRPWKDIIEMDNALIDNWNSVVRDEDDIYHLGDVTFHNYEDRTLRILHRLNGRKYLIVGNHDRSNKTMSVLSKAFSWCKDYHELHVDHRKFVLCHFPFVSWNSMNHGSINVHGHTHGTYKGKQNQFDAGVDCNGYTPVSLEALVSAVKEGRDRLC